MSTVTAYRCPDCDELRREEDLVRAFECSRCGGQLSEDEAEGRRCPDCNIFMAKIADQCCAECFADLSGQDEDAWEGDDGELYESEEAEQEFIAGAAERERKREEGRRRSERILAEIDAASRARNAVLLPQLRRLYELLAGSGHAADLRNTVVFAIKELERRPESGGDYTPAIKASVMARLLAPELSREADLADDVMADYDVRQAALRAIADRVIPLLASSGSDLASRLETWHTRGGSPCIGLSVLAPVLVAALEEKRDAPLEERP